MIEVIIRDRSSGKLHRRWRADGSKELLSFEADNADDAGEYDIVDAATVADAAADSLCKRCFIDTVASVGNDSETFA